MVNERLTIPVLPRLKVSIIIVSGTYYLRARFNTRYLWIGLNWIEFRKWAHVQFCYP